MDRAEEMRRRIDAALGFAGLSQDQLTDREDISFTRSTLNRKRSGQYEFTLGDLYEISRATGAPVWFLQHGWSGWSKELSPEEIQRLVDSLDSLPPDDQPDG